MKIRKVGRIAAAASLLVSWSAAWSMESAQMVDMPAGGLKKAQVEQRFGTPELKRPPVGYPPHPNIERWEYPGYTVYFEWDTVITSVSDAQVSGGGQLQ